MQAAESALAEFRDGARQAGGFAVAGGLAGELQTKERKDGLRGVVVTVRWKEPGGQDESVEIVTAVGGGS